MLAFTHPFLEISVVFLPFVDRENKQLLWQTPLPRCTIPSFLILKLNSRTEIFLARIHLVPSEINWVHPFVGQLPNLIKSILQQKNLLPTKQNFCQKCLLSSGGGPNISFLKKKKKCFVQSQSNRPAKLYIFQNL